MKWTGMYLLGYVIVIGGLLAALWKLDVLASIVANDGLAFYPDWPAPGYMDVLGGNLQDLIGGKATPTAFLDAIAGPWKEYKATLP